MLYHDECIFVCVRSETPLSKVRRRLAPPDVAFLTGMRSAWESMRLWLGLSEAQEAEFAG